MSIFTPSEEVDKIDIATAITLLKNLSARAATRAIARRDVDAAAAWFMDEAAPILERVDLSSIEEG